MIAKAVFWASASVLAYSYVLFPAMTFVRARLKPRLHDAGDITPTVSVVIAARNEATHIGTKMENLKALDYPAERLQIIVASDGSTDGTAEIVAQTHERAIVLDLLRVGKGEALEAGVRRATGEILVFSDANSLLASDAIRELVRPFADPAVGGVAGNQVYQDASRRGTTARGERSYWDFDRALKTAQSRSGNVIGATGALYAIRRDLFRSIPAGVTDDFFLSLAVIHSGYRLVFAPAAVAYEGVAASNALEYRRKVRIMTRGLRCVAALPDLLDPRKYGFFSVQLLSHKVLMRISGVPLLLLALASMSLAGRSPFYRAALAAQALFYGLGLTGLALAGRPIGQQRLLSLPAYFCLVQAASVHATWNLLTGHSYDRWEPTREGLVGEGIRPSGRR